MPKPEILDPQGQAVANALRWQGSLPAWLAALAPKLFGGIGRVAFAASKADHVAERQRGNLAALAGVDEARGIRPRPAGRSRRRLAVAATERGHGALGPAERRRWAP